MAPIGMKEKPTFNLRRDAAARGVLLVAHRGVWGGNIPPNTIAAYDTASLYSFADVHFAIAMDEGTVNSQALTVAAFGLLLPDRAGTGTPAE